MVVTPFDPVSISARERLAVGKLSLEIEVAAVIRDVIYIHRHHVLDMAAHIGLFGTIPITHHFRTNMFFTEVQRVHNLQAIQDLII